MKRLFLGALLCCLATIQASSQDIYSEVKNMMDSYQSIKDNASKSLDERKVATFKWDAIYYLVTQANSQSEVELGAQVAAMTDFVNLYLKQLQEAKGNQARQVVMSKFKNASLENALYNDTDKELIYAYVDNNNFLTQFSLDTDWVRALQVVVAK